MIPKIIHYCWFGRSDKPKLAEKCIRSWKRFCPDYDVIEWNEDNFDINTNPYTKMCYENRKYAFLTDYVRLVIVEKYGGIYMDTDVELLKSPSVLLENEAYIGFETNAYVNTGLGFGSVVHGAMVQAMLNEYAELLDGQHGTVGCPILNTKALELFGLQKTGELQNLGCGKVLPVYWLNPYDSPTGHLNTTENTISIHWYSSSWMGIGAHIRSTLARPLHRLQNSIGFFEKLR